MKISNSERNRSFTEYLATKQYNEQLNVSDEGWIHFLQDHRSLLEEHSTKVVLTEEVMQRYRYRIRDYLDEVHNHSRGGEQAFMVVNRLHNNLEFTYALGEILVPDINYLNELRRAYRTNLAMEAKLD